MTLSANAEPPNPIPDNSGASRLARTSALIALLFIVGGAAGLLRQMVIGAAFGAGAELDAFIAAFRIPEVLFTLVAGGALASAFIPVFSRFLANDDADAAWRLASAVVTLVAITAGLVALFAFIFAEPITRFLLMPGGSPQQQTLTAELMRIMLITVVIFSVSGLSMGLLNALDHFLAPALAPSMNNLGLILGALLLAPGLGVYGLAYGAVLGAVLHFAVQIPALWRRARRLRPSLDVRAPGAGEVLLLMLPRIVGQGAVQLNFVVNVALASGMAEGSLSALTFSFTLMFFVLGVLGQSVGTAVFPTLSRLGGAGDLEGFRATLIGALRSVVFMALPATVGLFVLAPQLVETIFGRGQWTPNDTLATAWALRFFSLGLVAFALQEILARAFFALRDTLTPVLIAVGGVILNIALSLLLINVVRGVEPAFGPASPPLNSLFSLWRAEAGEGPFGGLALANVLATMLESAALWLLLRRRAGGLDARPLRDVGLRAGAAAVVMGVVVLLAAGLVGRLTGSAALGLVIGTVAGVLVFGAAALGLKIPEARAIPAAFLSRIHR